MMHIGAVHILYNVHPNVLRLIILILFSFLLNKLFHYSGLSVFGKYANFKGKRTVDARK